ncbi:MAG: hypothetical protein AB7F99_09720 [Vicinamibacterales bacterium]
MRAMPARTSYVAAAVAGALLWGATAALSGRREAWDAAQYWTLVYPASVLVAAALGFLVPHRGAWRLGFAVMLGQALALVVTSGSFGLLPPGIILFAVLAILPAGAAAIASAVGRRLRGGVAA